MGLFINKLKKYAREKPDALAVISGIDSVTYGDLDFRSTRLAHQLVQLGIGPEVIVGLCLERGVDMILCILAVHKAGGAYLPLDPIYPENRLRKLITDSGAQLLVTEPRLKDKLSALHPAVASLNDPSLNNEGTFTYTSLPEATPEQLAYVIYTSGSTGSPKGVCVTRHNLESLLQSSCPKFDFKPDDVWMMAHSLSFDFSVWEIFGALWNGAPLVLPSHKDLRSTTRMVRLIVDHKVTILNQVPPAFQMLKQELMQIDKLSLKYVIFGGDRLKPDELKDWSLTHPKVRLVNMYGITETTVHTTFIELCKNDLESGTLSVGQSLPHLSVHILDQNMELQPPGVPGEIYVGGEGVARGYLGKPKLTEERFIADRFNPRMGARMYRSGDLGRYRKDGGIDYLGRIDNQVKIRGFRIELGEIESALCRHPEISSAAIIASENDTGGELKAFLVTHSKANLSSSSLRSWLGEQLPEHMIPARFMAMDSMPITRNGKLDRKALENTEFIALSSGTSYRPPHNPLEQQITEIWQVLLKRSPIGIDENFFDLGGDSLMAMEMIARIEKEIGTRITLRPLLEGGTIAVIASSIAGGETQAGPSLITCTQQGSQNTPFFFAHGDFTLGGLYTRKLAQCMDPDRTFYSLAPVGTYDLRVASSIEEIASINLELIRSVQPKGPYHLGGFCNGALAMYEVTNRLLREGETVSTLLLLDPPHYHSPLTLAATACFGNNLLENKSFILKFYGLLFEFDYVLHFEGIRAAIDSLSVIFRRFFKKIRLNGLRDGEGPKDHLNRLYMYLVSSHVPSPLKPSLESSVIVFLRRSKTRQNNHQTAYWRRLLPKAVFSNVLGSNHDLRESLEEVADVIRKTSSIKH